MPNLDGSLTSLNGVNPRPLQLLAAFQALQLRPSTPACLNSPTCTATGVLLDSRRLTSAKRLSRLKRSRVAPACGGCEFIAWSGVGTLNGWCKLHGVWLYIYNLAYDTRERCMAACVCGRMGA